VHLLASLFKLHINYHREHRGAARYTEETFYFYSISSCTYPCLLCSDNNVLFIYQLGKNSTAKQSDHREHRGAARCTEKLLALLALLLVFSVVIIMFYFLSIS